MGTEAVVRTIYIVTAWTANSDGHGDYAPAASSDPGAGGWTAGDGGDPYPGNGQAEYALHSNWRHKLRFLKSE